MSCWVNMELGQFGWGMRMVEEEWRKGPWTTDEDKLLTEYVRLHSEGRWNSVARLTGLRRNGKSCRLRWVNYLRPDLKRGQITPHEETIILELHARWGNRWSTIARSLPGRTDNEVKNYWRTHFKSKTKMAPPCSSHEKIKARLLKKQQFQDQQQQQQQQELEHQKQQQKLTQLDITRIMFLLDDTTEHGINSRAPNMVTMAAAENMAAATATGVSSDDEPGGISSTCYSSTFRINNNGNNSCSNNNNNNSITEDMLWDESLWNLEDVFHGSNNYCAWVGLQYIRQNHY